MVIFISGKRPFPEEKGGTITHFHLGKSFLVKITINWIKIYPCDDSGGKQITVPNQEKKVRRGIVTQENQRNNTEVVVIHDDVVSSA